jgi:hypothetical protein
VPVGLAGGRQPLAAQAGGDEAVHRRLGPAGRVGWRLGRPDGLKGPVLAGAKEGGRRSPGPAGAACHPGSEVGHGGVGQPAPRRHPQVFGGMADGLDQQALVGIAGHDGRPAGATLEQCLAAIDAQAAAGLRAPVALEADIGEDETDFQLEEGIVVGRRGGGCGQGQGGGQGEGPEHASSSSDGGACQAGGRGPFSLGVVQE